MPGTIVVHDVSDEHTDGSPYCDDPSCPCHILIDNLETYDDYIDKPLMDGLITWGEAQRLHWNKQV